jgi:AcrR family transcriptional regulator
MPHPERKGAGVTTEGWMKLVETETGADAPLRGKAATQQRILRAAAVLFVERGYERTTIADVAVKAGVSRATVFWHFSDKAGLFRESFSFLVRPFRDSLERDLSDLAPEQRLLEQVGHYQSIVRDHEETIQGFLRWVVETPALREWIVAALLDLHQRFTGVLSETLSELLPPSIDPGATAAGLMSMLDGALILSLFDPNVEAGKQRRAGIDAVAALISRKP